MPGGELAGHYERLRAAALRGGEHGGLGMALLTTRGMAAWMRAWRTVTLPPAPVPAADDAGPQAASGEVVSVLASMALACVGD